MKGSGLILVVDSDPGIREFMQMALSDDGYDVRLAEGAAQALEIVRTEAHDLIILELRLPEMSGLDFLKAYQLLPVIHVPIIAVSTTTRDEVKAMQLGAARFLLKPFDLNELLTLSMQMRR